MCTLKSIFGLKPMPRRIGDSNIIYPEICQDPSELSIQPCNKIYNDTQMRDLSMKV